MQKVERRLQRGWPLLSGMPCGHQVECTCTFWIAHRGGVRMNCWSSPSGEAVQRLLRQIEFPPAHLQEYHCWMTFGSTSDVWHTASSPVSVDTTQAMPSSEKLSLRRGTTFGPPSADALWLGLYHVYPTIKSRAGDRFRIVTSRG